jgi:hypothetical protein
MLMNEKINQPRATNTQSKTKNLISLLTLTASTVAFSFIGLNVYNINSYHQEEAKQELENNVAEYNHIVKDYMNKQIQAQQNLSFTEKKHDFHFSHEKLSSVLDELSQTSGYQIKYDKKEAIFNEKISAVMFGQSYQEFLIEIARVSGINYKIDALNAVITVYPKEN